MENKYPDFSDDDFSSKDFSTSLDPHITIEKSRTEQIYRDVQQLKDQDPEAITKAIVGKYGMPEESTRELVGLLLVDIAEGKEWDSRL